MDVSTFLYLKVDNAQRKKGKRRKKVTKEKQSPTNKMGAEGGRRGKGKENRFKVHQILSTGREGQRR